MLPLRNETVKIIRTVVVKLVSDLRQIGGVSPGTPVSSTNKTDRHDIAEIVLKVVLNTNSNPETVIPDLR